MRKIFTSGLMLVIPTIISIFLIYWLFTTIENLTHSVILFFLDNSYYFYGLGWITTLVLICLIGFFVEVPFHLTSYLGKKYKSLISKFPLFKSIYDSTNDLMQLLTIAEISEGGKVVRIKTPIGEMIGIVTQDQLQQINGCLSLAENDAVAVYVPMSFTIGGYTYMIERKNLELLDIPVKEAFALSVTGYISASPQTKEINK
jgi:uncharacterized membrane protein